MKATEEIQQSTTCVICENEMTEYGNNPDPIMEHGMCCNRCDGRIVLPMRFLIAQYEDALKTKTEPQLN
jgi:hypothetical protein